MLTSILNASEAIRRGKRTPLDVVDGCLAQIDKLEDQIHAWVMVDREGARAAAKRAGEELKGGKNRGPLHGIPIGIKDLVDVAGWPTLAGSPTRKGHVADADAPVVARLKAAGAIILGKTVTTEFACFDPPPTKNPWNLEHTPGGSSSGSAAAVAVGMCLGAIGSQTGGSITRPASYCGVAGCKPTIGRVSTAGIVPISFTLDHPGPIARRVADLAILLDAIRDPRADGDRPAFFQAAEEGQPALRLALVDNFFFEGLDPESRRVTLAAVERLSAVGAKVERVDLPPSFAEVHAMHRRVMSAEGALYHRPVYTARRSEYGPAISQILDEGLSLSAADYIEALEHRTLFRGQMAELFERTGGAILLTPGAPSAAPGSLKSTGDPRFNSPWSYSGLPTVSFPCGLAGGMPVALQLVGPADCEAALFADAAWCEKQLGFDAAPANL